MLLHVHVRLSSEQPFNFETLLKFLVDKDFNIYFKAEIFSQRFLGSKAEKTFVFN